MPPLRLIHDVHIRRLALLGGIAAMLLAGCGGGADNAAPATSPTGAPSAPAAAPAPVVASNCGLPDFAASALSRINQLRAAGASCGSRGSFAPAVALTWSGLLTQAADAHSLDMASNDFFSHTSADGRSMSDRVNATGYSWSGLGENIAAGYPTVNAVIDGWMASDGHCANIMNRTFDQFGLACVNGAPSSAYGTYWTMDLATAR
jgi:uncharacterized protein YkwD